MEPPAQPDARLPGRFYDADGDIPTDLPATFRFERLASGDYRVARKFDYVDHLGRWYRVPHDVEDNRTDFASVPFFLTWLVPRDGDHTPAAVLHDALIGGRVGVHYDTSDGQQVDDRHADYLFREAMTGLGVTWLRRWLMWVAVVLRTLCVDIDKSAATGIERQRPRWSRIVYLVLLVVPWAIVSALMALDVPDIVRPDVGLPWLDQRPWWQEIPIAVLMVIIGAAMLTVLFGIGLRSTRGAVAGAFAGLTIGFLGLPMVASLVGAGGYWVIERVTDLVFPRLTSEVPDD